MNADGISLQTSWADAVLAARLFAVDAHGLGGVCVRARPGPVRDAWLAYLAEQFEPPVSLRRIPLYITDGRLLGGLDLAATLASGRPVAERGVLAEIDNGIAILPMAERLSGSTAARFAAVLDSGAVVVERDGVALVSPARLGIVLLDEGTENERPPAALLDRCAFHVDLSAVSVRELDSPAGESSAVFAAARLRLLNATASPQIVEALCSVAQTLGIDSLRASLLALRAARSAAALAGRAEVTDADAGLAARLVLAPRAITLPQAEDSQEPEDAAPPDAGADAPDGNDRSGESPRAEAETQGPIEDTVLEAVQAAIPAGLLLQLQAAGAAARGQSSGRAGALRQSAKRGRPIGARRGVPGSGARLSVMETLRAAAPWQQLRQREASAAAPGAKERTANPGVHVRREDFHVARFKERAETTTIFVVDASGSSALHRLAEAKGAVELLLADCYVRRDRVAVIGFRGRGAELLLSPTRSLVRAKRSLAGMPGGGGTPLAAAIDAAGALADAARRRGETPTVVLLTDGRANVARDGAPGREQAAKDATSAARLLRAGRFLTLLVDTSPQPQAQARELAGEMGARYLALPHADAVTLSSAVQAAAQPGQR